MMNPKIEEIIQQDGQILETTHGVSMEPMLKQGRNPIVISRIDRAPKRRDVILFRVNTGKYILHRVIKVKKDCYITRGDNMLVTETVHDNEVVGILTGYYKGEKYVDCQKNFGYRVYSFFVPLRFYSKKLRICLSPFIPKCLKKLIRKFRKKQ